MRKSPMHTSTSAYSIGALILRVGAGSLLILNHGYGKLTNFAERAQTFGDPLGIGSQTSLILALFAEVFCAALVVLGLFTRWACIPIIILFGVIVLKVAKNISAGPGGGAMAALFLIIFISIALLGPGRYSIDKLIGKY